MNKRLSQIIIDKTSGSTEILLNLNEFLLKNYQDNNLLKETIKYGKKLNDFSSIQNYLKELQKFLEKNDNILLQNFLNQVKKNYQLKYEKIYNELKKHLADKNYFLTLSNSHTLYIILKMMKNDINNLKIAVAESRPMMEGKILANKLLKLNIKVDLITDAMLSSFIPEADAVLIGADKILKNGNVVNKTGSRNAAIISKFFNKPFYVIATKEKYSTEIKYKPKTGDTDEVWKYQNKNLKIFNNYFEEIEKELITKIITD